MLFRQIEDAREAEKKINELNKQAIPLKQQYEQKALPKDLVNRLKELEQQVVETGYDAVSIELFRSGLKTQQIPDEWEALQKAKAGMISD